jgi:carboxylate-amine ligase
MITFWKHLKTNCIDNPKKIWWICVTSFYDTIEFRICDMSLTVEETMYRISNSSCLAKLYKLNMHNMSFNVYRCALIKENKFRAARYGIEGSMIDFGLKRSRNKDVDFRIT